MLQSLVLSEKESKMRMARVAYSHRNLFELGPASWRTDELRVGGASSMTP